jgi:hypothetical protein
LPAPQSTPQTAKSAPQASTARPRGDEKVVRRYKGLVLMRDSQGVERWRVPKGRPDGGDFAASPIKTKKAGKGKAPLRERPDDGPQMDENGNWVKPAKEPEDRYASGGGVGARLLGLARKYASGGAVTGALVGNTGGRADKLKTAVRPGSHIVPADVVSHHGEGNTLAGFEVMKRIFGDDKPEPAAMAAGGEVPVYLSDGEYAVSPEGVARYGGHEKIDQFILASRAQAIETLKRLPPPAK